MAEITGEKFTAKIITVHQDRVDTAAVKELLGEDVKKVMKTISMEQLKCSRHSGEKRAFRMPNLANATPEGLVDMLGDVREQIADLKKLEGIYKEALSARLKD